MSRKRVPVDPHVIEIELAGKVQQLLLPKSSPVCSWCCTGVKNRMASGVGGDYFDFLEMTDGCQGFFLGDVTGHGIHASMVMSLLYGFIHRGVRGPCDALGLMREVNDFLISFAGRSDTIDYLFSTTLFFGTIDPVSRELTYVNAAHPCPLVRRGDEVVRLTPTSPVLGYFDRPEIECGNFSFLRNDRLLLYTDGVTEAANASGELFGIERVERLLRESGGDTLEFLDELDAALRDFGAPDPPLDDCTAMVVDFTNHSFL